MSGDVQQHGNLLEYLQSFLTSERRRRLEEVLGQRTRRVTVVLENVYQPHNTSAVLRSCDAFGIQDVHIVDPSHDFSVTREIALGSDKWLTIHRNADASDQTGDCIRRLRAGGYRIAVTSPAPSAVSLNDLDVTRRTAIVIGHETDGVSERFCHAADEYVTIPMFGFVESLNLSVAAAICLYELTKRLRESNVDWRLTPAERDALRLDWTRKSVPHLRAVERRFAESHFSRSAQESGTATRPLAE